MTTAVFWNISHKRQRDRAADPLGLDALREAMADCLVPHLTGGTRHADDYLWVLVGLRWAREAARTPVDADVWEEFRKFERALKQYWQRFTTRRDFLGKLEVSDRCKADRPDVSRPILVNERATGILGTYIASLRAIGLVDDKYLAPSKAGENLVRGVAFPARARTFTSWPALRAVFAATEGDLRRRRPGLGPHVFHDDRMHRAAIAFVSRRRATAWNACDRSHLSAEQRRVAHACPAVLEVEEAMVSAFAELLDGRQQLDTSRKAQLRATAARVLARRPIPDLWMRHPLAAALERAWTPLARGRSPEPALLDLHIEVTLRVRGNDPWVHELGEETLVDFRPTFGGRDFRFGNLARLVSETRWSPRAARA